jgi:hypothetical protein
MSRAFDDQSIVDALQLPNEMEMKPFTYKPVSKDALEFQSSVLFLPFFFSWFVQSVGLRFGALVEWLAGSEGICTDFDETSDIRLPVDDDSKIEDSDMLLTGKR